MKTQKNLKVYEQGEWREERPSQHTPGPWTASGLAIFANERVIAIADDGYTHSLESQRVQEANARLIAAAPELLAVAKLTAEFCRYVLEDSAEPDFMRTVELRDDAKAAIAKAEGRAQ
jgi:hypothetical protein